MRILIGCEESQVVTKAFREKGHEAYSCDIQDCSGSHPEWHYKDDIFNVINLGWDMAIFHPPCQYLSNAGNDWFNEQKYGMSAVARKFHRTEAVNFFCQLLSCSIPKICVENPPGYINHLIKPTQTIHPYFFGDAACKRTCLWLKNLPALQHYKTDTLFSKKTHVHKGETTSSGNAYLFGFEVLRLTAEERRKIRSKTYASIAKAMADQWV